MPVTSPTLTALMVSPIESDQTVVRDVFTHSRWKLHSVSDFAAALDVLNRCEEISVVICEYTLRDGDWKVMLNACARLPHSPRVIVCSRLVDVHLWVEVLQMGGYDALTTPLDSREVSRSVSLAWQAWRRESMAQPVTAINAVGQ